MRPSLAGSLSLALSLSLVACGGAEQAGDAGTDAGSPPAGDAARPLDTGSPASDAGCTSVAQCDDGLFCNGVERCTAGACLPAAAPACTTGMTCNEQSDQCATACVDLDADGACADVDCDDTNARRFPGATELCDGIDQDCNPATLGRDEDSDGSPGTDCCNPQPSGPALCGTDCDDTRATVSATAVEACNGRDDDCDGVADDGVRQTYYEDMDGDGFGVSTETRMGCMPPLGFSAMSGDCNDQRGSVNPAAAESCATAGDENCNGTPDEGCACTTGMTRDCGPIAQDRIGICRKGTQSCIAGVWEASCGGAVPAGTETCNTLDDDCDGTVDDGVCVACGAGFRGVDGNCTNIDECAENTANCDARQSCMDRMPGFLCGACPMGFTMPQPNVCADINECLLPLGMGGCDPLVACQNTIGSRTCAACPVGYTGTGDTGCTNVDECMQPGRGGCDPLTSCTDEPGSRTCGACPVNTVDMDPLSGTRCVWNVAVLEGFATSVGVLDQRFEPDTTSYSMSVRVSAQTIAITPLVPAGFAGTITVQAQPVTPGAASAPIALPIGTVDVSIVVTAAAGATRTYVLRVARGWLSDPVTGYVKSSNPGAGDEFGTSLAISGDGSTLAVGSTEDSSTTGIGSTPNEGATDAGAVYVFRRSGAQWVQEAYVKASNTGASDRFGRTVALSYDGSTLAVGADLEDSSTTGAPNEAAADAGAVYVFRRAGTAWTQQAYLKASNGEAGDQFGFSVALSSDGNVLAVGAFTEDSGTTGVGSTPNEAAADAGAVYVFRRAGAAWSEEAYVKASNAGASDRFGADVALSGDGALLAVGARNEASSSSGINSTPNDLAPSAGAVYVFRRTATWAQEAYVKASNPSASDQFGIAVALSLDGRTLAVGAPNEDSSTTGVGSSPNDGSNNSGAAYVFRQTASVWAQEAYVKATNTGASDRFGTTVALAGDGGVLAVGADSEDASTVGVGGTPNDGAANAGAAYVLRRSGSTWAHEAFVKASNTGASDAFGTAVALDADGAWLVAGAPGESSSSATVPNEAAASAGAVYALPLSNWRFEEFFKSSVTANGENLGFALALSADGSTLAVGAPKERSSTSGINPTPNTLAANSGAVFVYRRVGTVWALQAFIKASNPGVGDLFGTSVALSADGSTLAVGAPAEASSSSGVTTITNEATQGAGAVYVFQRTGETWVQEAFVKSTNPDMDDVFGEAIALSGDGATLAVAATGEDSSTTGVGSVPNESASLAGAVYVYRRTGTWAPEAYLKASNTGSGDYFGTSIAISFDGATLAVGAPFERTSGSGINPPSDEAAIYSGAVYVFRRAGTWSQEAFVKASNNGMRDEFGRVVALSGDGTVLAVSAMLEDSSGGGPGVTPNESLPDSGAVYVLRRTGATWAHEVFVKARNAASDDAFGSALALSQDGSALVVGAALEDSSTVRVGSVPDEAGLNSGAAYVVRRAVSGTWFQEAYVKPINTAATDHFGERVAISADGATFCVGAPFEDSGGTGAGSTPDEGGVDRGAVYSYR